MGLHATAGALLAQLILQATTAAAAAADANALRDQQKLLEV